MELRITKDAQAVISEKLTLSESTLAEVSFFEVWGVHVFGHRRRTFFLLTEGSSYFSIISPLGAPTSQRSFESNFKASVSAAISSLIEGPLPACLDVGELVYAPTKNDGLRRAQADQMWRAKRLLDEGRNTFQINRVPHKSLGFRFPVDLFIQGVSGLLRAHGDFRVFVPNDVSVN